MGVNTVGFLLLQQVTRSSSSGRGYSQKPMGFWEWLFSSESKSSEETESIEVFMAKRDLEQAARNTLKEMDHG